MAKPKKSSRQLGAPNLDSGNHISEWLGHRIYPSVKLNISSFVGADFGTCPFLSEALSQKTACVKGENSFGVCTVSSVSNGPAQDWLVCPYRVVSSDILQQACRLIFGEGAAKTRPIPVTLLKTEGELNRFRQQIVDQVQDIFSSRTSSAVKFPSQLLRDRQKCPSILPLQKSYLAKAVSRLPDTGF